MASGSMLVFRGSKGFLYYTANIGIINKLNHYKDPYYSGEVHFESQKNTWGAFFLFWMDKTRKTSKVERQELNLSNDKKPGYLLYLGEFFLPSMGPKKPTCLDVFYGT